MLLVKSKELKNSNKKRIIKRCKTIFYIFFITLFPLLVQAQTESKSQTSTSQFVSIFLSLLLVIVIILALAYFVRRFNVAQAGNGQLKIVASLVAGTKEKVMVIEVGNEQHLLGVTANNINHLAKLDQPLKVNTAENKVDPKLGFQQKLVQAMAQRMNPSIENKEG